MTKKKDFVFETEVILVKGLIDRGKVMGVVDFILDVTPEADQRRLLAEALVYARVFGARQGASSEREFPRVEGS